MNRTSNHAADLSALRKLVQRGYSPVIAGLRKGYGTEGKDDAVAYDRVRDNFIREKFDGQRTIDPIGRTGLLRFYSE